MIRRPIPQGTAVVLGGLSLVLLLGAYSWLAYRQHKENPEDTTIPPWKQLAAGGVTALEVNPTRTDRVWGARILGTLMGCFAPGEGFLQPPLSLLAKIPPTAALAVFFVLVGTHHH